MPDASHGGRKERSEMKQGHVEEKKGKAHSNGFFLPEPIPEKWLVQILTRKRMKQYFREQDAMLDYVVPLNHGNGAGSPDPERVSDHKAEKGTNMESLQLSPHGEGGK